MIDVEDVASDYIKKFGTEPWAACMSFLSDEVQDEILKWSIENDTRLPEDEDEQDALIRKLFPEIAKLMDDPDVVF